MRVYYLLLITFAMNSSALLGQQPAEAEKPPLTTLTGCLRSSGADTAVAGPSGRLYTLEVIDPPAKPAASSGTAATTPPAATKTTYSLSAPESVGLAKHADHEVRLTGRLQAPRTPPTTSPAAAAASKPTPGGGHRTFEVTALEMVAAKCRT